ncbi:hypothetical protein [Modestobacter excelsi]|uniref:hypothetical protein n=1 Tax=Modestobacter excelsi TaxID=2213161 RepID=UPI00110CA056|nr:hypothetical protein [Modestobacter excelsi]
MTTADLAVLEEDGRRHDLDVRVVTTALARPGAALSHGTAARLWRLPLRVGLAPEVRLVDRTAGAAVPAT